MKRIVIITTIISLATFTTCNNQLNIDPIGQLDSETFYRTEEHFEIASLSPYSTILNLYFDQNGIGMIQATLYPSDDVRAPIADNNLIDVFSWLPNNESFTRLWNESYKGVMRANVILRELADADGFVDESNKVRFEAEARFLRAYFYFILARHFGEVPLIAEPIDRLTEVQTPNSEPGEVWDFIEADLRMASSENNLPDQWDDNNLGRVTKGAANALLGKVLLFRAQWENNPAKYTEAVAEFNDVVNSGVYQLVPSYNSNFLEADENNAESIFEIQMTRGDDNTWLPTDQELDDFANVGYAGTGRRVFSVPQCFNNDCAPTGGNGYGKAHITQSLRQKFEAGDPRRLYTLYQEGDAYLDTVAFSGAWSDTGSTPYKYVGPNPFSTESSRPNLSTNNEREIRYADVLLMLAEAELLGNNNAARAAELINQVRARARSNYQEAFGEVPPADLLPDRPVADVNQMHEWIRHERRVELALESKRYDDLVRWHRAGLINIEEDIDFGTEVANRNWDERHLLKPIPQEEISNNTAIRQNDLY